MKSLIIYKTKWGSTKQYAEWIKEEFPAADLFNVEDFNLENLKDYDRIVIGSRTYMGRIQIQDFLEKNWDFLKNKEVFLFSVGMVPWDKEDAKMSFDRIPLKVTSNLEGHVKLPGKIDMNKIGFFNRFLVKAMQPQDFDLVDRKTIKPIVNFLKK